MNGAAYRVDSALVAREEFYRIACDPARSVVVEACAGAGKTWMLVSRILRALLDGVEPQQILAITFTKKAAAEMRHRLMQWLAQFAACSEEQRVQELVARGLDPAAARRQAPVLGGLYERLLCSPQAVEIRTFHAWFSQLMRAAPLEVLDELGLPPQAELLEDVEELKPQAWRQFLAAVAADEALRADFEALVLQRGRHTAQQWLLNVIDKRVEFELAARHGVLERSVPPAAALDAAYAGLSHPAQRVRSPAVASLLREVAQALGRQGKATPQKQAALLQQALEEADDLRCVEGAFAALCTKAGEPRKHLDAPGLDEAVAFLRDIRVAVVQHEAHLEHQRMVRLAQVLLEQYARVKRARGLADMADLERCALRLLQDVQLAGWLQERLDARIRQVLIDEFQDTNPLQWQALSSWLGSYAGAGGGASGQQPPGIFIVGDPKQSIYRFRRAEPRVFDAAKELVRELGGAVLACDHTRRNAPGVLEAVNAVFRAAQDERAYGEFRAHTTEPGHAHAGEVAAIERVERPAKETAEEGEAGWRDSLVTPRHEPEVLLRLQEARRVAGHIARLVAQGRRPGDIFVLSRKRASLRVLAEALRELHLPFATPEDSVLMDALEVRDVVALLDALVSPQHDLSLAHALRSPIFGASDADLVALAQAARAGGRGWMQALAGLPEEALSPALQRARRLLAAWREDALRLPPHDLLDRIVAQGELRARYAAAVPAELRSAALAHLDALLALALELDGGRYATPYKLVRALRRRPLSVKSRTDAQAVQLLTVHGAKGLEAPVVFIMDTDSASDRPERTTALIDWPAEAACPDCFAFIASEARVPPSLAAVLEHERQARAREELNGLYVAMTRAREQLVFSATAPHRRPSERTWWERIGEVPGVVRWEGEPEPAPAAAAGPGAAAPLVLCELPALPRAAEAVAPSVPQAATTARVGEAVHRALEWLTARPDPLDGWRETVAAAARAFGLDDSQRAHAEHVVARVLTSDAFRPFLAGERLRWAGNEVPLAHGGQVLRVDRLVQLADGEGCQWWVLDYKLDHAPHELAAYREQLARYREAVREALAGREPHAQVQVRAAFVTGRGEVIELPA
ncbi:UvrD-helicase domain-containing protein [Caldimonas thermodepolymerans]|uniref:DNA 3'-5' helicase n=1 Tax=Caldimonas thermodepolymerans TaxID=215580 RepID=A0A2S5T7E2_9BURK|nr:UvrD-helicase domain-containing protein [Caldimonas thermodepolymerans]PPE70852.1 DNA helicase UvrD [Caldimonas thermodepolymerans]QPC33075.1 UvrD-helicase domain-containing protein [Caldimonas thermodepolymerans]RDI03863.1 ATP-dependent helicase/nuclease subunit A [Caldimonas thermodepolymerans]TCP09830.1 ATP-dependent helicase/nuclease subunit A [Caldimonas thermodepolymerans]UZG49837.1 UvrD-helicase domain-containing protein [Caldimonas thermodepolymerans]